MSGNGVDPEVLHAWLAARSIARGLPPPIAEFGGFRVDTNAAHEIRRWVFPKTGAGLFRLARTINAPAHFLKLCGPPDELEAALPIGWELRPLSYFMTSIADQPPGSLPPGYTLTVEQTGSVTRVAVECSNGETAASGYAAETADAFIYDRIVTAPEHRRRGLASAVLGTLHQMKRHPQTPQLLVATEEGRALYDTLGWRTLAPYSTAVLTSGAD